MSVEAHVDGLSPKADVVSHGMIRHTPRQQRRFAAQALAFSHEREAGFKRLAPLAFSAIVLAVTWYMAPERDFMSRVMLSLATMILVLVSLVLLRNESPDGAIREILGPDAESEAMVLGRPANISRDFERFMIAGIANSRRRGRKVGLLELSVDVQDVLARSLHHTLEEIADNIRDHTRVYDYVHVPGDGTILVFLSHLPADGDPKAIASRILDDGVLSCSALRMARRIGLRQVSLEPGEETRDLVLRLADQELQAIREKA